MDQRELDPSNFRAQELAGIEPLAVAVTTPVDLGWLRPELDRCRELIATHPAPKRWPKSASRCGAEVVTEIDLAVERLLIDAISAREPTASFLSEESHPDPAALASNRCFVIDPIDGTEELAAAARPRLRGQVRCGARGPMRRGAVPARPPSPDRDLGLRRRRAAAQQG